MSKNATRKAPALDFSSLTAEAAPMPKRNRTAAVENTPFPGWLRDSREDGHARRVTVPAANVGQVVSMVRSAANLLGIGSRVVITDSKGNVVKTAKEAEALPGNVTVTFAGKQRKAPRKAKQSA